LRLAGLVSALIIRMVQTSPQMAVERDQGLTTDSPAEKPTEGDPLKELAGLAEGLEADPTAKEELHDYEEVLAPTELRRYKKS